MTWYLGMVLAAYTAFTLLLAFYSTRAMFDDAAAQRRGSAAKRPANPRH